MKLYNHNTLNYTYNALSQSAQKTYTALLTAGKKYRVSFDFIIDGITTATYTVINGSNTVGTKLENVTNHEVTEFTATNTNLTLVIELSAGNYGRLAHIDNLEIAEIAEVGESYRFGFNGKENDNEVSGGGNWQDYGMRMYSPRLGRFPNVDPLIKDYPELTPYQFASNLPVRHIDLDGLEAGDPMYWIAEGFRQYFDAGLNSISIGFEQVFNLTSTSKSDPTKTTVIENNTTVSYDGWDLFKPNAWPAGKKTVGSMPAPRVTAKNTTTVQSHVTIKKNVGATTVQSKKVVTGNQTTTTKSASTTATTNTGVPVTFSASSSTTNSPTVPTVSTNNAKVTVGPNMGNVFVEASQTTAGGKSTTTATVGANSSIQSPSVGGVSVGTSTTIKASVTTSP